jgi:hypothetical protein
MSFSSPHFRNFDRASETARRLAPIRLATSVIDVRTVSFLVSRQRTSHVRASARDNPAIEQSTNALSSPKRLDVAAVRFGFSVPLLFDAGRGLGGSIGGKTEQPGSPGGRPLVPLFIGSPPTRRRHHHRRQSFAPTDRRWQLGACPVVRDSWSRSIRHRRVA